MALIDNAVFKVGTGHFYTAPVGTALPANLAVPGAAWTEVGHTSVEDILSASSEGGEATTHRSLQSSALRVTYAARTETWTFNLLQFDTASLRLYFGQNASIDANGNVQVPDNPQPTERAFLIVFRDGHNVMGLYAEKASIFRGDDFSFGDIENLSQLSLAVKPLVVSGKASPYTFISPKALKATATGSVVVNTGTIEQIVITDGGSGYTSAPTVTITGTGGSGATATATVTNGVVTAVTIGNAGTGYTAATVTFSAP
jgi:hypothetical protein